MNSNIFIQALQIIFYRAIHGHYDKKVHGWEAFDVRAGILALVVMSLNFMLIAQNRAPDLQDANIRTGTIVKIGESRGGRRSSLGVWLQESDGIHGYLYMSPIRTSELQWLIGKPAVVWTWEANSGLFWLKNTLVLEIEAEGKQVGILPAVRNNQDRFRDGFISFAKWLLVVAFAIYLSLVRKLYKKKIVIEENKFVWAEIVNNRG
jgi:hypothetical protein